MNIALNNRELSLLTWVCLLLIWLILKPEIRTSLFRVLKYAFTPKLSFIYCVMAAYTTGMVFLLKTFNLWDTEQLKNTIFWFISVGVLSLYDITNDKEGNYFRKTIKDIIGVTTIVQFIVGVYSFSFILELLILPIVTLIFVTLAVSEYDPKHRDAKKFLSNLLTFIGLLLIIYTIFKIISDFKSFANSGTLGDFLTPAALSILFLPLVYLLSVYISHEDIFTGITRILKKPALVRYAKIQTLIHFNINKADLKRWRKLILLRNVKTKRDIRKSISFIKKQKRLEKNPPPIDPNRGWSPYKAKDFLIDSGLITGFYSPYYENEWSATAPSLDIEGGIINSSIGYSVEGDNTSVVSLTLSLNINDSKQARLALIKFLPLVEILFSKSIGGNPPHVLRKHILNSKPHQMKIKNLLVSFNKDTWHGHKLGGYRCSLNIRIQAT